MAALRRQLSRSHLLAALLLAFPGVARAQSSTPPPATSESAAEPAPPPAPPPATVPTPAPQKRSGRLYSWGSVGTTFAYGQTYGSANLGVGWMMLPSGIAPNVEVGYAFGNSPTIWSVRPGITWYMPLAVVRPYIGAYYAHWFVGSGLSDQNGIGGRAGFSVGRVLSLGVTYEHALGCSNYCDSWAPTISAGLSL
jgi:hypothetical protein